MDLVNRTCGVDNADTLGIDPSRIGIGGDSAGSTLAGLAVVSSIKIGIRKHLKCELHGMLSVSCHHTYTDRKS